MTMQPEFDPRRAPLVRRMLVENADGAFAGPRPVTRRVAFVAVLIVAALGVSSAGVALAITGVIHMPDQAPPAVATTVTPTVPPRDTPTVTPAPAPAPTAPPVSDDPSTWLIDFNRVGPISLGQTLDDAITSMPQFTVGDAGGCPAQFMERPNTPGVVLIPGSDETILAQIDIGDGAAIGTSAAESPRTAAGIGIGSTHEELSAAYPDIVTIRAYDFRVYYGITDGSGSWIMFGIDNDTDAVNSIVVSPNQSIPWKVC